MISKIAGYFKRRAFRNYYEKDACIIEYPHSVDELLNQEILCLITPGRSGTKTFINYARENTSSYSVHSPVVTNQMVAGLYSRNKIDAESAFWAYISSRETYLLRAYTHQEVFIDGDCKYLPIIPIIAKNLPNTKFIHLVRGPESFIKSGLQRGYFQEKPADFWGYLDNDCLESQVEKIAWFWDQANILAEEMKHLFGNRRVQTIRAEDMFRDSSHIANALSSLDLPNVMVENPYLGPLEISNAEKPKEISQSLIQEIEEAVKNICSTRTKYGYK